jgi:hypothetical protein
MFFARSQVSDALHQKEVQLAQKDVELERQKEELHAARKNALLLKDSLQKLQEEKDAEVCGAVYIAALAPRSHQTQTTRAKGLAAELARLPSPAEIASLQSRLAMYAIDSWHIH